MGKLYVLAVSFFASLGTYLAGYSAGSVNGLHSFPGFLNTFGLSSSSGGHGHTQNSSEECATDGLSDGTSLILGAMISTTNIGGAIGNLFGGVIADKAGRRVALHIAGVLVILGGSIQCAAFAAWMFIAGRFTAGLGYGLFYMAGSVYIAEIAPKSFRGACTAFLGLSGSMGILTGYVSNIGFTATEVGWKLSRLLACVFASVFTIGVAFLPRSPRWLMLKGLDKEAREVLKKIHPIEHIDSEVQATQASLHPTRTNCFQELRRVLKWQQLKKVLLGSILHAFTSITGNALLVYSTDIFCTVGVEPFLTTIIIGILTLCGSFFVTVFVDKIGRKTLLLSGSLSMAVLGSTAGALVYTLPEFEDEVHLVVGYVIVVLVSLFILLYTSTLYTIPWIITSEVYPLHIRGSAVAISTSANWFSLYLCVQLFPLILLHLSTGGTLFLLAGTDLLAFTFYLFCLPETKGIALEHMEELFNLPWPKQVNVSFYIRCGPLCPSRKSKTIKPPREDPSERDSTEKDGIQDMVDNLDHSYYMRRGPTLTDNTLNEDATWEQYWEEFECTIKAKETSV